MKLWQKFLLLFFSVLLIVFFIKWWMSYEPMEICVENERNQSVNVSIIVTGIDGREFFNKSVFLSPNESMNFSNITNLAGSYFVRVRVDNESREAKIKFGKYFEKIEIIVGDEIIIRNLRE